MSDAVLRTEAVDVRFGGLRALANTSVDAQPSTITGLIGPNGAGKTTLFNVITGLQNPAAGRVLLEGRDVTRFGVHKRARMGVSRTFQKLEAFNSLSARDNVLVAAEMASNWHSHITDSARFTDEILERVGLSDVAELTVGTLPTGTARLVELARALAGHPKILLLDEASSGLTEDETTAVGDLLAQLVAEDGLAVLLVEHDMSFVMRFCSRIHVLDFGQIIAVGSPSEIQHNEQVRTAYLGSGAA
ncbi:MAG: ABC transporter ATP-binding protein [Acidimicrobiia bacterium]|nr:ABC transporter ATP-binding protein [Acidimicrobiia bacterium]MDH5237112.1 ABC transporter ATP-binding protein [Acidimicrobiia bacterium]